MKQNITYYLTMFWGVYLIVGSLGMMLFPAFKKYIVTIIKNDTMRLGLGILLGVIGILHISFHNVWAFDFRGLITLFGWLCLTKAILLVMFDSLVSLSEKLIKSNYIAFAYLFMICLGFYLILSVNPYLKFD